MAKKKGIGDPVHVYNSEGLSYSPKGNVKASLKRVNVEKAAHGTQASANVDAKTGRTKSPGHRSEAAGAQPSKSPTGKARDTDPRSKGKSSKAPGTGKRKTASKVKYTSRSSR